MKDEGYRAWKARFDERGAGTVRITQRFEVPAERVFEAWVDPAMARTWLFATASRPTARVEIDPRVGGSFRLLERSGGTDVEYRGRYVEIVPPRRLVFTLAMKNGPKAATRVIAEIVPRKTGCELTLTHENVPPGHAHCTEGRWAGMLYGLGTQLR
jgi:uncharacterized protein YndB with AHSA1/START domain